MLNWELPSKLSSGNTSSGTAQWKLWYWLFSHKPALTGNHIIYIMQKENAQERAAFQITKYLINCRQWSDSYLQTITSTEPCEAHLQLRPTLKLNHPSDVEQSILIGCHKKIKISFCTNWPWCAIEKTHAFCTVELFSFMLPRQGQSSNWFAHTQDGSTDGIYPDYKHVSSW